MTRRCMVAVGFTGAPFRERDWANGVRKAVSLGDLGLVMMDSVVRRKRSMPALATWYRTGTAPTFTVPAQGGSLAYRLMYRLEMGRSPKYSGPSQPTCPTSQ